jgi:hypothetical protein
MPSVEAEALPGGRKRIMMADGEDMAQAVAGGQTEISVKGDWVKVRAMQVNRTTIIVRGNWLKIAYVHDEAWLETEVEDPKLCIRRLKEKTPHGLRADIFTFAQKLPQTTPKYSYPVEWESTAAIPLTSFQEWWEKLPQETRKNVRRSQKRGVVIRVNNFDDAVIRGIVEVNNDSPVRQGRRFTHYGKTFDQVKKDHSSFLDRSDFICAYSGEEFIGFLKIVYRGEIASILQLLAKAKHYDGRPSNAMIAKAVELCAAKKISYITYGLFNYGNKRDSSVVDFKTRNGFQEILAPRYFVPLTRWGMLATRLKLHRGLHGILPNSAITLGVNVRLKWYNFKQFLSRCSSVSERPNRIRQTERSIPPAGSNGSQNTDVSIEP